MQMYIFHYVWILSHIMTMSLFEIQICQFKVKKNYPFFQAEISVLQIDISVFEIEISVI